MAPFVFIISYVDVIFWTVLRDVLKCSHCSQFHILGKIRIISVADIFYYMLDIKAKLIRLSSVEVAFYNKFLNMN